MTETSPRDTALLCVRHALDKKGKVAYKVVGPKDWTSTEVLKFLDVLVAEDS